MFSSSIDCDGLQSSVGNGNNWLLHEKAALVEANSELMENRENLEIQLQEVKRDLAAALARGRTREEELTQAREQLDMAEEEMERLREEMIQLAGERRSREEGQLRELQQKERSLSTREAELDRAIQAGIKEGEIKGARREAAAQARAEEVLQFTVQSLEEEWRQKLEASQADVSAIMHEKEQVLEQNKDLWREVAEYRAQLESLQAMESDAAELPGTADWTSSLLEEFAEMAKDGLWESHDTDEPSTPESMVQSPVGIPDLSAARKDASPVLGPSNATRASPKASPRSSPLLGPCSAASLLGVRDTSSLGDVSANAMGQCNSSTSFESKEAGAELAPLEPRPRRVSSANLERKEEGRRKDAKQAQQDALREYFSMTVLAVKLNADAEQKNLCSEVVCKVNELFSQAIEDRIPMEQWHGWVEKKLVGPMASPPPEPAQRKRSSPRDWKFFKLLTAQR